MSEREKERKRKRELFLRLLSLFYPLCALPAARVLPLPLSSFLSPLLAEPRAVRSTRTAPQSESKATLLFCSPAESIFYTIDRDSLSYSEQRAVVAPRVPERDSALACDEITRRPRCHTTCVPARRVRGRKERRVSLERPGRTERGRRRGDRSFHLSLLLPTARVFVPRIFGSCIGNSLDFLGSALIYLLTSIPTFDSPCKSG